MSCLHNQHSFTYSARYRSTEMPTSVQRAATHVLHETKNASLSVLRTVSLPFCDAAREISWRLRLGASPVLGVYPKLKAITKVGV